MKEDAGSMLKVIGAGWGRTGTTSTLGALEELGFGPCYTFFTIMSARQDHFARWMDIYAGRPADWPALFEGFNSVVDWPACDFYADILSVWPQAKIILNVRDPHAWYKSMQNTIYMAYRMLKNAGDAAASNPLPRLLDVMLWQRTFHGRFDDEDYAIAAFERHIDRVKQSVPAHKLLVFDVKEGWEPLCAFLDVPVPDRPFPHLNDTTAFQERVTQIAEHSVVGATRA